MEEKNEQIITASDEDIQSVSDKLIDKNVEAYIGLAE